MRIQVLHVESCPHEATSALVREILVEFGRSERGEEVCVLDLEDAYRHGFPGFPPVRIDGEDVDPVGASASGPTYGCRPYAGAGIPDADVVRSAVRKRLEQ